MYKQCLRGMLSTMVVLLVASGCDAVAGAEDLEVLTAVEWTDSSAATSAGDSNGDETGGTGDVCEEEEEEEDTGPMAGQACSGHCKAGIDPKDEKKLIPVPDLDGGVSQCPSGQKCKFGADACKNKKDGDASEDGECKAPAPKKACAAEVIE
jgi:hypothetical protein